jgi:cadmium resistance protein CadD (predicted permease)
MPIESLTVLSLVCASYVATNVDNLLLLVSWAFGGGDRWRQLFVGHVVAAAGVLLVSFLLALSSTVIPVRYVGYLGFIPVLIGARLLLAQVRHRHRTSLDASPPRLGVAGLATTLFSNSVDTIVIMAPLLADSQSKYDRVILAAFLVVVLLWFALACLLQRYAARLRWLASAGHWLAPLIMIAIGFYILDNTITDTVTGH